MTEPSALELSLVLPAYNEAGRIEHTLARWIEALDHLGIAHEIIVIDDGSTDGTGQIVETVAGRHASLRVIHQANQGHGPAVISGYRAARGSWVFQVDADDEVGPGPFPEFWRERADWDLLLGVRQGRRQSAPRALVSWSLRRAVAVLVGRNLRDVNSPYRLIRRDVLEALLSAMPASSFSPNALMSALGAARGLRVGERDVPLVGGRESGALRHIRLLRMAVRSFVELVAAVRADRGRAQGPATR